MAKGVHLNTSHVLSVIAMEWKWHIRLNSDGAMPLSLKWIYPAAKLTSGLHLCTLSVSKILIKTLTGITYRDGLTEIGLIQIHTLPMRYPVTVLIHISRSCMHMAHAKLLSPYTDPNGILDTRFTRQCLLPHTKLWNRRYPSFSWWRLRSRRWDNRQKIMYSKSD